jgi:hypothetical protein
MKGGYQESMHVRKRLRMRTCITHRHVLQVQEAQDLALTLILADKVGWTEGGQGFRCPPRGNHRCPRHRRTRLDTETPTPYTHPVPRVRLQSAGSALEAPEQAWACSRSQLATFAKGLRFRAPRFHKPSKHPQTNTQVADPELEQPSGVSPCRIARCTFVSIGHNGGALGGRVAHYLRSNSTIISVC